MRFIPLRDIFLFRSKFLIHAYYSELFNFYKNRNYTRIHIHVNHCKNNFMV